MDTKQTSMDMIDKSQNTVIIGSELGHGIVVNEEHKEMDIKTKYCPKCKRVLPVSAFSKSSSQHDGYQDRCKDCKNAYQKEYYYRKKAESEKARESKEKIVEAHCKKDLDSTAKAKVVVDEKERTMLRVYTESELAKFTPRQLMAELKARGYRWEYMLEPQRKVYFDKI